MARPKQGGGQELELRVARVEFAEGAFTRTQVIVPDPAASPGRDVLTDLDVMALDFDSRLRHSLSVFECKSGRGQAQEADRLLWLAGVKTYVRADRAVLVRGSVSGRGRAIARRLGVETLDSATLALREGENAWVPSQFAHLCGSACAALEAEANRQLKAIGDFPPELGRFLFHDALRSQAHIALGHLSTLSEVRSRVVLPTEAALVLAGHALILVALAALRVASWLDFTPATEVRRLIARGVTLGDPYDSRTLRLLANADAYYKAHIESVHAEYVKRGATRAPIQAEPLAPQIEEPPGWLDRFVDLAERFRANATVARTILQTLELAVFDGLVGDNAWKAPSFDHLFTPEHKNLVTVSQAALEAITGPETADHVGGVTDLPYDRIPAALPDRRSPPTLSTEEVRSEDVTIENGGQRLFGEPDA